MKREVGGLEGWQGIVDRRKHFEEGVAARQERELMGE
jgi:hypothetical protein